MAENLVGEAQRSFVVRILGPPVIDLGPSGSDREPIQLAVGGNAVLQCWVFSASSLSNKAINTTDDPAAAAAVVHISWSVDGRPVVSSPEATTEDDQQRQSASTTTSTIKVCDMFLWIYD